MKLQRIALGLCLVALAACGKRLDGSMLVSSNLTINTKKGPVTIPAGTYYTVVKAGPQTSAIEMSTSVRKVAFKLPTLPELKDKWGQGRIYLTGSQIGQPFDVDLDLDVSSSDSAPTVRTESCVYDTVYTREWVCRDVRVPGRERCYQKPGTNGDERSDFECRTEYYWERQCGWETRSYVIYGDQTIHGYYTTLRRTGTLKLIRGGATVARLLDDKQSSTSWNTTRVGPCRRR
jgi:hypothetical protein